MCFPKQFATNVRNKVDCLEIIKMNLYITIEKQKKYISTHGRIAYIVAKWLVYHFLTGGNTLHLFGSSMYVYFCICICHPFISSCLKNMR